MRALTLSLTPLMCSYCYGRWGPARGRRVLSPDPFSLTLSAVSEQLSSTRPSAMMLCVTTLKPSDHGLKALKLWVKINSSSLK
jgi:hypothetical protein